MKLLIVNHTFRTTDGQGLVNAELARHLAASGHEVHAISGDQAELPTSARLSTSVSRPTRQLPTRLLRHWSFGAKTARCIAQLRPHYDLVIANGGMTFARVDVNISHFVHSSWIKHHQHPFRAANTGGRAWAYYQFAYSQQAVAWERVAYSSAKHVVAISETVRRQLSTDARISEEKISVIENGLEPCAAAGGHNRKSLREQLGLADDQFVIFFAGELRTPRKNFDVLLSAIKQLPHDCILVAAGDYVGGPYETVAKDSSMHPQVRMLGFRSDVKQLYAVADLFCLLSHYEPFGLVVTEAMATGVPVVTSRNVGAADIVQRHGAGIVLPDENDAAQLAAAIDDLRANPSSLQQMAERALEATEELSWPRVVARYECLFERILAGVA